MSACCTYLYWTGKFACAVLLLPYTLAEKCVSKIDKENPLHDQLLSALCLLFIVLLEPLLIVTMPLWIPVSFVWMMFAVTAMSFFN